MHGIQIIQFTLIDKFFDAVMLPRSRDQGKKIGTIFSQIGPRAPSGLIFKVFAQIFDAHSSFVFLCIGHFLGEYDCVSGSGSESINTVSIKENQNTLIFSAWSEWRKW